MPTVITHSVAALALGKAFAPTGMPTKFWLLTAGCAMLPDLDVIAFVFDIRYSHMLGHRGLTHSFPFALVLSPVVVLLFFREVSLFSGHWWILACYFFVVTASHPLLDALTNGGLGVALFAPFSNERYFSPVRPIEVSPIGVDAFLSPWGRRVIISEFKWIWLPSGVLVAVASIYRTVHVRISECNRSS